MPAISEAELKKQLKTRSFSPVYLIYGDEQMYVKDYTRKICDAVTEKAPSDFNFHAFKGELDLAELDAATQVIPFMSEFNCVLAEDIFFDLWKRDDPKDYFLDIISRVGGSTVLVISMPSYVPKTNAKYFEKVEKAVKKHGSVCRFEKLNDSTLEKHITKWAGSQGKLFERGCSRQLINLCGSDLHRLKNETDKLCAYSSGEEITLTDISAVVVPNLESRIFDITDAVMRGQGSRAYEILDRLFSQREIPDVILTVLGNNYIDLYRAKLGVECGKTFQEIARDFDYGNRSFALKKVYNSSRLSNEALLESIRAIIAVDQAFKSLNPDKWLMLEQLIAKLLLFVKENKNA